MAENLPLVRVVVINFDGGQMTIDCLQSLLASDWPADRLEIVMVDNGSIDDVANRVRVELPMVRVIEPFANTGFARGCNLGIQAPGNYDLIALVNNDAVVDPGWLRPLVDELDAHPRVGAVSPKMVFNGQFVEVAVEVPDAAPIRGDGRTLGARFVGFRLDGERADERITFDEGFFPLEAPHRPEGEEMRVWSWRRGHIRVRVDEHTVPESISMKVSCASERVVRFRSAEGAAHVVVGRRPRWVELPLGGEPFDVINNAGSALYPNGYGGDRGFLERDAGQYDVPADVFAWCGGAVLLRREYLDDVGLFDERLFLYYEDTDLSWRGRLRGWEHRYVPTSLVRHRHAQSSIAGSRLFRFQTERNRPLVLAKNAPRQLAARAGRQLGSDAVRFTARHVIVRPLTLHRPLLSDAAHRWRVFGSYVRHLPGILMDRWRGAPKVDRRSLMFWQRTKEIAS